MLVVVTKLSCNVLASSSSASDLSCGRSQQFHHLINTLLPQKAYVEAVLKKSQIGASWWRNDVELDFSVVGLVLMAKQA